MSSEMMSIGMGRVVFPAEEIADLSTAPKAPWYMAEMSLLRPQTGPGDPGPAPTSSCNACITCRYCFSEGRLPPGETQDARKVGVFPGETIGARKTVIPRAR